MRSILYTGKGGVGKTTIAAATACKLAKDGRRVLIMSTDQAHSLADSFEMPIGNEETEVAENLYAMEIDAVRESELAWGKMKSYFRELLSARAASGIETEELLVFPGLEELFSLLKIVEISEAGKYDALIVDCAPTGETLSLLKFPEMFGNFVESVLPMKRKALKVAGPAVSRITKIPMPEDSLFDQITELTHQLEKMQKIMSDKENVSLRIVTTPERIVIKESKRNYTWLHLFDFNVDAVIVNKIYPQQALEGYFAKWMELQAQGMKEIGESFAPVPVFNLNLSRAEIKTIPLLSEAAEEIFDGSDPSQVFFCAKIFEIEEEPGGYLFRIFLPFAEKQDMELTQSGGEIILGIQNERRRITLPDVIRNREVGRAKFEAGALEIHMI